MAQLFTAVITSSVRGAGTTPEDARDNALARLTDLNAALQRGEQIFDPGIDYRILDPGGGPCQPRVPFHFLPSGDDLPEAQERDD